jgi:hypothetical protein
MEYGYSVVDTPRPSIRWVEEGGGGEERLRGTNDIQSLADLANSFAIIKRIPMAA